MFKGKKLFSKKAVVKNDIAIVASHIEDIDKTNHVTDIVDKLIVYYDHIVPISNNVVCILGWERIEHTQGLKFKISNVDQEVKASSSHVIRYKRPDVNKHFDDSEECRWGVLRVVTLEQGQDFCVADLKIKLELDQQTKQVSIENINKTEALFHALSTFTKCENKLAEDYLYQIYGRELLAIQQSGFLTVDQLPGFIRMHWENALLLPSYGVFMQGWLIDAENTLKGIYLKQGTILSENLLESVTTLMRPDVNEAFSSNISKTYQSGLYGVFNMENIDASQSVSIVLQTKDGKAALSECEVSNKGENTIAIIQSILAPLDINKSDYEKELSGYLGQAIKHIWQTKESMSNKPTVVEYGVQPQQPVCSLIIPIYGRYDFVKYQITQFSQDEFMASAEIIYVLDDPRLLSEFNRYCDSVYTIFKMPFKTVSYSKNLGFAGANNIGVSQAKSEYVLLLNSDVMPKYSGWLEKMIDTYTELETPGILGARLLFEDNTIQHDGLMYQKLKQYGSLWLIEHPAKGLPDWMAPSEGVREIPSVTGACMLMRTSLYQELNGLDESYVLGDFEDSDLCLKALQAGYKNYINSDISLYHLERQSQNLFEDKSWKHKLTIYNGLQHTKRWDKLIETMDEKQG